MLELNTNWHLLHLLYHDMWLPLGKELPQTEWVKVRFRSMLMYQKRRDAERKRNARA